MADPPKTVGDPAQILTVEIRGKLIAVEFVHHAMDRMKERGIGVEDVLTCIRFPDEKGLPADQGRHRVRRWNKEGSRALDVIYELVDGQCLRVITALWKSGRG